MVLERFKIINVYLNVIFFVLMLHHAQAQGPIVLSNQQAGNLNNIKKYINESPDTDSALFYAQKFSLHLTKETTSILSDLIHYSIAEMLINTISDTNHLKVTEQGRNKEFARALINSMT